MDHHCLEAEILQKSWPAISRCIFWELRGHSNSEPILRISAAVNEHGVSLIILSVDTSIPGLRDLRLYRLIYCGPAQKPDLAILEFHLFIPLKSFIQKYFY